MNIGRHIFFKHSHLSFSNQFHHVRQSLYISIKRYNIFSIFNFFKANKKLVSERDENAPLSSKNKVVDLNTVNQHCNNHGKLDILINSRKNEAAISCNNYLIANIDNVNGSRKASSKFYSHGKFIKGILKATNSLDAYFVPLSSDFHKQIPVYFHETITALNGDVVEVKLLSEQCNSDLEQEKQKDHTVDIDYSGIIVNVIDKKHPRIIYGYLELYVEGQSAVLVPNYESLHKVIIPIERCPDNFKHDPHNCPKVLYLAEIKSWRKNYAYPIGELIYDFGSSRQIKDETKAILDAHNIRRSRFSLRVLKCLPEDATNWKIPIKEFQRRKDLRNECIFTIDPSTARDLDDALSCKKLPDGNYEVGVHIADVSFFVEKGTPLDLEARKRGTSVYLPQKVIPMLPEALCENLCSLNAGVDRLAFSVIWKLSETGNVLSEWFGRTVINSCSKLTYDHAQKMIDLDIEQLDKNDFPDFFGGHKMAKIANTVKMLHSIAKHLREQRFESGALDFNTPKLAMNLSSKTLRPSGVQIYRYKDSNKLIEEFMLLANMSVAHKIYKTHPKQAILRLHPPPHRNMMIEIKKMCKQAGISFDISTSATISKSLRDISNLDNEFRETYKSLLTYLCVRSSKLALYFCSGTKTQKSASHFALNVPKYTHFTSPIRRYPDLMVHRLLASSFDKTVERIEGLHSLKSIVAHCNDTKYMARKVSDESNRMFFRLFLLKGGPLFEKGIVSYVTEDSFFVFCETFGLNIKVNLDEQPSVLSHKYNKKDKKTKLPTLKLSWENTLDTDSDENWNVVQEIAPFSSINVLLSVKSASDRKISVGLVNPNNTQVLPKT